MATSHELPVPPFYRREAASQFAYRPKPAQILERAEPWRRAHGIRAAGHDERRIVLLIIDAQRDFCFPSSYFRAYQEATSCTPARRDSNSKSEVPLRK